MFYMKRPIKLIQRPFMNAIIVFAISLFHPKFVLVGTLLLSNCQLEVLLVVMTVVVAVYCSTFLLASTAESQTQQQQQQDSVHLRIVFSRTLFLVARTRCETRSIFCDTITALWTLILDERPIASNNDQTGCHQLCTSSESAAAQPGTAFIVSNPGTINCTGTAVATPYFVVASYLINVPAYLLVYSWTGIVAYTFG